MIWVVRHAAYLNFTNRFVYLHEMQGSEDLPRVRYTEVLPNAMKFDNEEDAIAAALIYGGTPVKIG